MIVYIVEVDEDADIGGCVTPELAFDTIMEYLPFVARFRESDVDYDALEAKQ